MEKNWVCIYSTDTIHLAEIAKAVLEEHDIESVIINKKDSNHLFGYIEIYVNRKNALTGKYIIRNIEDSEPENRNT